VDGSEFRIKVRGVGPAGTIGAVAWVTDTEYVWLLAYPKSASPSKTA
jgi:hypothetical protein